MRFIYKKL